MKFSDVTIGTEFVPRPRARDARPFTVRNVYRPDRVVLALHDDGSRECIAWSQVTRRYLEAVAA